MAGRSRAIRPEFPRSDYICKFFSWMQLYATFPLESWNPDTPVMPTGTPPAHHLLFWKRSAPLNPHKLILIAILCNSFAPLVNTFSTLQKNSAISFKLIKLSIFTTIYSLLNKNFSQRALQKLPRNQIALPIFAIDITLSWTLFHMLKNTRRFHLKYILHSKGKAPNFRKSKRRSKNCPQIKSHCQFLEHKYPLDEHFFTAQKKFDNFI